MLYYSLRLIVVVLGAGGLWVIGLILFTRIIPSSPQDMTSLTDGIVVFTGGETRLKVALSLFEQKKGKYLLISGVNPHSTLSERVTQMPFHSHITLGYDALDTLGNAEETAAWAHAHHIKTLRLITSNYHMPRSLFELRHLVPDIQILPHAVVGKSFLKPKWWLDSLTLRLVVQEYNKFLFALIRRPLTDFHEFWKFKTV
ncbi:MAG: YdcF family protein [Alphaproteobacteria bacterium]|nr:YdcF family protein [Alphaproteobacteria bacterium]